MSLILAEIDFRHNKVVIQQSAMGHGIGYPTLRFHITHLGVG